MNSFAQSFQNAINNPLPIAIVMKFNALRIDPAVKRFVFVEGSSDERFYSKVKNPILQEKTKYIFQDYAERNGGKESVFFAYNKIKTDENLKTDFYKCVYIVDRDWDSSLKSVYNWVTRKDEKYITITKGHSMECYFLEDENVKAIFSQYGIAGLYEDFYEVYKDFISKTTEYWALKAVVQYAFKSGIRCRYKKQYDFSNVFIFDFSKKQYMDFEKLDTEVIRMKEAIENNEQLSRYFDVWKNKIINEPRLIRGHNLFDFLLTYLNSKLNKPVSERELYKLVSSFVVDLDIKQNDIE